MDRIYRLQGEKRKSRSQIQLHMENTGSLAVVGGERWRGFDTIKVVSPSTHEWGRSSRRGIMSPRDIKPCKRGAARQAAARDIPTMLPSYHRGASRKGGLGRAHCSDGSTMCGHELWLVVTVPTVTTSPVSNGDEAGGFDQRWRSAQC